MKLCTSYEFQAPVPMRRRRISDLLVRATRGTDGGWGYKVVGVVNSSFSPEALA